MNSASGLRKAGDATLPRRLQVPGQAGRHQVHAAWRRVQTVGGGAGNCALRFEALRELGWLAVGGRGRRGEGGKEIWDDVAA